MRRVAEAYTEVLPACRPGGDLRIVRVDFERILNELPRLLELLALRAAHERQGAAQETDRSVASARLHVVFDERNIRIDTRDNIRCNQVIDLVHGAVG